MKAVVRARRGGSALCTALLGSLSGAAHADLWSVDNSVQSRLEFNDNVSLSRSSPGIVNTLSLSNTLNASRQMENSATRLNAAITALRQRGNGGNDRVDGRLAISQSLTDPLNSFSVSAQYAQDFNNVVQDADVTVGRGQRRTSSLSASWSRALSELLSVSTQISTSRTDYGQQVSGAVGFSNAGVSAGLSYRVTETDTASLQLSHSEYRAESGANRSQTNFISFGMSRVLSERVSASLNLGVYRTESSQSRLRIACPLQLSLCNSGLVPFILVQDQANFAANGLQYSSTYNYRFRETSSLAFTTGNQQTPGGSGEVTRSDMLSLSLNHAFSETLSATADYAQSRSKFQGTGLDGKAQQRSFSVSISKLLTPELSLQAGCLWVQANNVGADNTARANSVNVSLQYDWSKLDLTR